MLINIDLQINKFFFYSFAPHRTMEKHIINLTLT
jgi:hypothetical protein